MTIAITGATGQLGRLTIDALLEHGVAPTDIVALVRTPAKAAYLAERGVSVRTADYDDPATLRAALEGVDRLLLISGSEVGRRITQHANAIAAATEAGVGHLVYTSVLDARNSSLALAAEHKATEEHLEASGIPHTVLRNGWYWENYANGLEQTVERGVLTGAAKDGKIAAAARADYAAAAATVLTSDGHDGAVYELGGDQRLTYTQLAEEISKVAGKSVVYQDLPEADYAETLEQAGLPTAVAKILADSDAGIAVGALDTDTGDLQKLIGRSSTPVVEVLAAALA